MAALLIGFIIGAFAGDWTYKPKYDPSGLPWDELTEVERDARRKAYDEDYQKRVAEYRKREQVISMLIGGVFGAGIAWLAWNGFFAGAIEQDAPDPRIPF